MADSIPPDPRSIINMVAAAQTASEPEPTHHDQTDNLPIPPPTHDDYNDLIGGSLEVDSGRSGDTDSTMGDDAASFTTSIGSDASEFRYEHGRRYHAYNTGYALPNDDAEIDRLELQHKVWSVAFNGKLYVCPLPSTVKHVLDVGTGTGSWAIDFADAHPHCEVLGTDLSPIQPSTVPVNCSFVVDDANDDWAFPHKFDFIHTRAVTFGIQDWDHFVSQAWEHLQPGGWIELHEFHMPLQSDDNSIKPNTPLDLWNKEMVRAAATIGVDLGAGRWLGDRLKKKGFVNHGETHIKIPIGPWAKGTTEKRMGALFQKDIGESIPGISVRLFTKVGYTQEQMDELFPKVREAMYNPKVHIYMPIDIHWAQKPFEE